MSRGYTDEQLLNALRSFAAEHDGQWAADRVGTDPDEYRVALRRDDATLRLYLDENAAVTRTERVQRRN